MARVASCPQCEHDLLVPDDAEPSALVKCPQCRAFFELQHAESRELPAALVVQSHPKPSSASTELSKSPTADDFSSHATLRGELEPISEEELKSETGDSRRSRFCGRRNPTATKAQQSIPVPRIADEPQEFKPAGTESHEEAAQRIDQWFRSAKTLSDLPSLDEGELAGQSSNEMVEPTTHASGGAPIDLGNDERSWLRGPPISNWNRRRICQMRPRRGTIRNTWTGYWPIWKGSQSIRMSRRATKPWFRLTKSTSISNRPAIGRPTNLSRFRRLPASPSGSGPIVRMLLMSAVRRHSGFGPRLLRTTLVGAGASSR